MGTLSSSLRWCCVPVLFFLPNWLRCIACGEESQPGESWFIVITIQIYHGSALFSLALSRALVSAARRVGDNAVRGRGSAGNLLLSPFVLSFYFILFFKSMKQVKRREESIMQIRSHLHNVS